MCHALSAEELARLAAIMARQRIEAGTTFIEEGAPADELFNLTGGTVKVFKLLADGRCQVTGFMMAGDFLGLSRGGTYAYSATAITPVTFCRFQRTQLRGLVDELPKIERQMLGLAMNELMAAQDQMVLLGRKTARERIASFLLALSARAVRRGQPANPVGLPMTRGDIADYLGLTTETVSRSLTQLKGEGLISLKGNHAATILDTGALAAIAGIEDGDGPSGFDHIT
ncbi:Crp/Fnr family transcriptional regulator [Zavarzinia compransoris]|uniref:Crp/Fnr family transcriptional regulator n=2 Tax=Zavarzinia compransoris TaxID=1264899 RepID=A0A317EBH5_9PROT|nr:Crp/Fnr family transcriptional regulator [Zavarzinia compransoris]